MQDPWMRASDSTGCALLPDHPGTDSSLLESLQRVEVEQVTVNDGGGRSWEPWRFSARASRCLRSATVLVIPEEQMIRLLHGEPGFSDRFLDYMLSCNIRIEEDLVDHSFNPSEKRLPRTLVPTENSIRRT